MPDTDDRLSNLQKPDTTDDNGSTRSRAGVTSVAPDATRSQAQNGHATSSSRSKLGFTVGDPPSLEPKMSPTEVLSLVLIIPVLIVGMGFLALAVWLQSQFGEHWYVLFLREAGAVLMVVGVLHLIYELVIHKMLHNDIISLGKTVVKLQRTVSIVGGAIESGLAAVYSSRDEVNRAILEEMEQMKPKDTLKILGISLGAFLCPHGALHGAFRNLLERKDITIEALILDADSTAAIERAEMEEPRFFARARGQDKRVAYETTRCHNELKTATDFAQDLADRCFYRDSMGAKVEESFEDAPNEPPVNAKFEYRVYSSAPLCYLVIFQDYMFLESYHNAGRGGEAPVLKIGRLSGESHHATSLFRIYENHFRVMRKFSRDRALDLHKARTAGEAHPQFTR